MNNPQCQRWQLLVQADHDGELGVADAAALAVHLDGCTACRALRDGLAGLSRRLHADAPRHAAPASLRAALERQAMPLASPPAIRRWRLPRAAIGGGAALAIAASVTLALLPRGGDPGEAAVASHIRALQPGHLTDVLSTDQHTVKPWFNGRLDYAPPVRDFAAAGFPLHGGRLDYLDGRAVAALVYQRGGHVIDLYIWPGNADPARAEAFAGYNVVHWHDAGMRFLAVSDLNLAELQGFVALWRDTPP